MAVITCRVVYSNSLCFLVEIDPLIMPKQIV